MTDQPPEVGLTCSFRQSLNHSLSNCQGLTAATLLLLTLVLSLTASVVQADGLPQPTLQLAQSDSSKKMGYGILSELRFGGDGT